MRPEEARVVAEATDAILNGGSLRSETERLNRAGAVTSTGRPWQPSELRKVLLRARNAGLREHRGEIVGPAEWPALVDEERWRAACSVLRDPSRRTSFSTARRWMLSSIALCGVCGSTLRVSLLTTTRGGVPSYVCKAGKCVGRKAVELEQFVSDVVVERLSRPDAIDLLQPEATSTDVGALRTEAAVLQVRLDDLADDLDIDERTMARRSSKLRERLAEVRERMAIAGRGNVLSGLVDAPDVAAAWRGLHLDRRRAIVDALMTITVHRTRKGRPPGWRPGESYFDPRTVEITWKT